MTNNLVLSLLALALAILAALFPLGREDETPSTLKARIAEIRAGSVIAALAVALFAGAVTVWPATFQYGSSLALAMAIGVPGNRHSVMACCRTIAASGISAAGGNWMWSSTSFNCAHSVFENPARCSLSTCASTTGTSCAASSP